MADLLYQLIFVASQSCLLQNSLAERPSKKRFSCLNPQACVLLYSSTSAQSCFSPAFLSQVLITNERLALRIPSKHLLLQNSVCDKYVLFITYYCRCWKISRNYADKNSCPHGTYILLGRGRYIHKRKWRQWLNAGEKLNCMMWLWLRWNRVFGEDLPTIPES